MPARSAQRRAAAGLAVAIALAAGGTLALEDRERARIERLAASGHCADAVAAIERRAATESLDARLWKVAGRCRTALGDYPAAVRDFERARALDPRLANLDLQLAIAQFHADEIDAAAASLGRARAAGTQRPELDFYQALVDLARGGDAAAAAAEIEAAGRARPETLEPAASYYAALAWSRAEDRGRARDGLERVVREQPGTAWASAAQGHLDRLVGTQASDTGPWIRATAGMEYDSNVAFLGRGLATPDEIGTQGDFRGVWMLDAGAPIARFGSTTIGARLSYFGSAHVEASDYDLEAPGLSLWLDRPIGERMLFRIDAGYQYAWLGYEPYVGTWSVTPQLFVDHGRWGTTRLFATGGLSDFENDDDDDVPPGVGAGLPCPDGEIECGPADVDERQVRDRDGFGVVAGIDHRLSFRDGDTQVHAGPLFEVYRADGDEWDSWGVGVTAGVRQKLPWKLELGIDALYMHRPYSSPTSYPDPRKLVPGIQYAPEQDDRTDDVYGVDVWLERPITDRLTASLRYGYLDNQSNAAVFDYDRHLVGAYMTYFWDDPKKREKRR